jgi:FkbM family methyltransferase
MKKSTGYSIKETVRKHFPLIFTVLKLTNKFQRFSRNSLTIFLWRKLIPKKNLLIYIGVNRGESLAKLFFKYKKVIAIEANPELATFLKNRFHKYKYVEIYNFAASDEDGLAFLKIPNNGNYSASATIDQFADHRPIKEEYEVEVLKRNLELFLLELNIMKIDSYISDCEGMDFIILNSLKKYIQEGRITEIQCEVQRNETPEAYKSISNKEFLFDNLLEKNYFKVAAGWTDLKDGVFKDIPKDWVFFDVKWRIK